MKRLIMMTLIALSCSAAQATDNSLPTLNKIESHTFQAPYSCNGSYPKSALFVADYSKLRNAPDVLLDGSCGDQPYIESETAGDDFALISDLGTVPLASVSAEKAFNYDWTVGHDNLFKKDMPIVAGHTYAILISKQEIRELLVLRVEQITPNGPVTIQYAVKSYSIQVTQAASPGFSWSQGNN